MSNGRIAKSEWSLNRVFWLHNCENSEQNTDSKLHEYIIHSSFYTDFQVTFQVTFTLQKIKRMICSLPEEHPQKITFTLLSAFPVPVMPGCLKSYNFLSQALTSVRVPFLQNYFQIKADHYNFAISGPLVTRIHSFLGYFPWINFFE